MTSGTTISHVWPIRAFAVYRYIVYRTLTESSGATPRTTAIDLFTVTVSAIAWLTRSHSRRRSPAASVATTRIEPPSIRFTKAMCSAKETSSAATRTPNGAGRASGMSFGTTQFMASPVAGGSRGKRPAPPAPGASRRTAACTGVRRGCS